MAANDHLGSQQFSGWMPLKSIKPTERSVVEREPGPAGRAYRESMRDHIAENGFTMGPLEVRHGKRFGNERKDSTYLVQGHHRLWAAKQLGMTHVPVEGISRAGEVPGLLLERP